MSASGSVVVQFLSKVKDIQERNPYDSTRSSSSTLYSLTSSFENINVIEEEFRYFIVEAHDLLISADSSKRPYILRALRLSIKTEDHIKIFLEEKIHYIVVISLEKDADYSVERMQALKLLERIRSIKPHLFPPAFGRSLVAIANCKEDNFRKISLEFLKELALVNPSVVMNVGGFNSLVDAIADPITQDFADSILITILYLLNDPTTRAIVEASVDLSTLLSPFTDLDSDPADLAPKWCAARNALVLMMRSWTGILQLSWGRIGLSTLIKMLQDPKVPNATQDVLLETVFDILQPIYSKVNLTHRNQRHQQVWNTVQQINSNQLPTRQSSIREESKESLARSTLEEIKPNESNSNNSLNTIDSKNSNTSTVGNLPQFPTEIPTKAKDKNKNTINAPTRSSFSFSDHIFARSNSETPMSESQLTQQSPASKGSNPNRMSFSISSLFHSRASPAGKTTQRRGTYAGMNVSSTVDALSLHGIPANTRSSTSDLENLAPPPAESPSSSASSSGKLTKARNSITKKIKKLAKKGSSSQRSETSNDSTPSPIPVEQDLFDPIYNMMDNYAALVCSAFLNADLITGLYTLGTHGTRLLALKSRKLMMSFLRVVANIFPGTVSSDLLTLPSLIEFASSIDGRQWKSRPHNSAQMLVALAETFTLMPYQEISGSHISGLTFSTAFSTRHRSTSNAASVHSNNSSTQGNGNSYGRSNFPALNIQTVYELAEEVKISSFSNIATVPTTADGNSPVSAAVSTTSGAAKDLLDGLREKLSGAIDKNSFMRQMEHSRVIGKEGKEPFKWDWVVISDMLEYSFQHPDRLNEALKTKWVRRVSGFYRCSYDEKGYFANLEWEPTNLQYLECACNMYSVLLKERTGLSFLGSDRRGMLFNEISNEIQQLVNSNIRGTIPGTPSSGGSHMTNNMNTNISKNVFRLFSCNYRMSREFFSLLGRIVRTSASRQLLDGTNIFQHLSQLGSYPNLEYLSRLALTSLSFTDGGFLSQHLLQLWTTHHNCSPQLEKYFHQLLRILLRSGVGIDSYRWCVDAIINQIATTDHLCPILCKALEEAAQNKAHLRAIISKRPQLTGEPLFQNVLIRFLSIPEGIMFLCQDDWLENTIQSWRTTESIEYACSVEDKISTAFNTNVLTAQWDMLDMILPIPLQTTEFLAELNSKQSSSASSSAQLSNSEKVGGFSMNGRVSPLIPAFVPDRTTEASTDGRIGMALNAELNRDPNSALIVDLHGLVRVPWGIEVKLNSASSPHAQDMRMSSYHVSCTEYLRVDCFLDTTELASPLCHETISDLSRIVKVRGIVLDGKGAPVGFPIPADKAISTTLLAGVCPVGKDGSLRPTGDSRPRRKLTVTSGRDSVLVWDNPINISGQSNPRQSLSMAVPGTIGAEGHSDCDIPITLQQENANFDWSVCKPGHRQGTIKELPDDRFAVTVAGEPVVWIFSRKAPAVSNSPRSRHGSRARHSGTGSFSYNPDPFSESAKSSRSDLSRAGGQVYLVEVQYYFQIHTGHSIFVPLPRHLYGELSRSQEGYDVLSTRNIVYDLLATARKLHPANRAETHHLKANASGHSLGVPHDWVLERDAMENRLKELRSALWSLGHIASTEIGLNGISNIDPTFVEWCIDNVTNCPHLGLRGTFFYVLGLISRTVTGARKLGKYGWESAPHGSNSAVVVPRDPSALFQRLEELSFSALQQQLATQLLAKRGNFNAGMVKSTSTSAFNAADGSISPVGSSGTVSAARPVVRAPGGHVPAAGTSSSVNDLPSMDNGSQMNSHIALPLMIPFMPFSDSTNIVALEVEVINLIAKLPGVLVYWECKHRLEELKRNNPELFDSRKLYCQAQHMMECYTFKLPVRREILGLFSDLAKRKVGAVDGVQQIPVAVAVPLSQMNLQLNTVKEEDEDAASSSSSAPFVQVHSQ